MVTGVALRGRATAIAIIETFNTSLIIVTLGSSTTAMSIISALNTSIGSRTALVVDARALGIIETSFASLITTDIAMAFASRAIAVSLTFDAKTRSKITLQSTGTLAGRRTFGGWFLAKIEDHENDGYDKHNDDNNDQNDNRSFRGLRLHDGRPADALARIRRSGSHLFYSY